MLQRRFPVIAWAQPSYRPENVTLHVFPDEDHSGIVLASMADSMPFLREAFVRQRMSAPHRGNSLLTHAN